MSVTQSQFLDKIKTWLMPEQVSHSLTLPPVTDTPMAQNPHRIEIRTDFPDTLSFYSDSGARMLNVIRHELEKQGMGLPDVDRIHVAYPHKNPKLFPGHHDNARSSVQEFFQLMSGLDGQVSWYPVHEIVENVRLGRSEDQSSIHALTARQVYEVVPAQEAAGQSARPFRFKDPETGQKEFFVIVDGCVEQGTTVANLKSYIELQGGHVLAAIASGGTPLVQRTTATPQEREWLPEPFNESARNSGRLVQLSETFTRSARKDGLKIPAAKCLEIFEGRLNLFGNSVFALTDGECQRLIETVENRHYGGQDSFKGMIQKLDAKLKTYAPAEGKPQERKIYPSLPAGM